MLIMLYYVAIRNFKLKDIYACIKAQRIQYIDCFRLKETKSLLCNQLQSQRLIHTDLCFPFSIALNYPDLFFLQTRKCLSNICYKFRCSIHYILTK